MSRYRCLSCHGRYDPEQADGALYFHVCPPLEVDPTGKLIERPDKRDENLVAQAEEGQPRMKLEGRGRELVTTEEAAPASARRTLLQRVRERLFGRKAEKGG